MIVDRESHLDELFHAALALPPAERDAFLARACAQDVEMLVLVKDVLRHHNAPGPADLDRPALVHIAEQVRGEAPDDAPELLNLSAVTPPDDGSPGSHAAEAAAVLPRRFGGYQLLRELGRGGMGVVYLAHQVSANRPVAVKVLRARVLEDLSPERRKQAVQRFRAEGEVMARLAHEHIITVYEVGTCNRQHYYSMRYVEGRSLAEVVRKHPLDGSVAAPLVEQAARAVHYAHSQGVLHRDLTPGNILLDRGNQPYVADFGLVKLLENHSEVTRTGEFLGTPGYVAPEQADDPTQASVASDVYSLGATLYHVLTGRPPFQASTVAETLRQVRTEEPVPPRTINPSVPRDLETICLKSLEKEPKRRYGSCEQLADDLARWQRGEPIRARPVRLPERCWRWCRRKPALAVLTAALVLVVLLALGMILASEARAREGERRAEDQMLKARAAQRNAEESHDTTLQLMHEALVFASKTPYHAPDQALPMGMLRELETLYVDLLRKRPEDAKLTLLLASTCEEQARRYATHKEALLAEQAYRRAAGMLHKAVQARAVDRWDPVLVADLQIRLGYIQSQLGETADGRGHLRVASRLLRDLEDAPETDSHRALRVMELSFTLAHSYTAAGEPSATPAGYRHTAALCRRLAKQPLRSARDRSRLAEHCLAVGHVLRTTGARTESPEPLELARQLYEGLVRDEPGEVRHLHGLSYAWYQLGQTRRILEQHDAALTAYRQSLRAQRAAFDRAPECREKLSLRYSRLAYWLRLRGHLEEAAASLLEQKKLWPKDAPKLREIAEDLSDLALAVGGGRKELTSAERAERQRYLDLSQQVAREAAALHDANGYSVRKK